jgi:hypothetical protein
VDTLLSLPAPVRHLVLLVASVLLAWAGTDVVPFLQNESNVTGAVASAALAAVLAVLTPLVTSYGVGSARAKELGV